MNDMTNFPTDLIKTVETVKTDTLGNTDRPQATNQEFLTTIFQDMPDDVRPILVGIEGQLDKATNKAWRGHSWRLDKEVWFDDANNYFSLAAFTADKEGRYSRRKANFAGLYCVMLDDIGSKVDSDKLTLEPTWLLETSTDNFQAGYAFSQPVADAAVADQLMNAIIEAELCDPGAGGPTARLARLPVGANGKYDPMFVCQLHQWHPHLRYTVDELVAGLGLTLAATRQSKKPSPAQAATGLAPSLYVPRPHTVNGHLN